MLAELPALGDFYLDSMSQVRMQAQYTTGRVALVGDSAYGNTLGGVGTGSPWSARTFDLQDYPSLVP